MKKTTIVLLVAVTTVFALFTPNQSFAVDQNKLLKESYQVLDKMTSAPQPTITPEVLNHARAIAIFPDYVRAGLIVGGGHGNGVLLTRTSTGWSDPVFVSLSGGSIGAQAGLKIMNIVMTFQNQKAVNDVLQQKFGVSTDTSVNAGEHTYYSSRWNPHEDIRVYSSTDGLYAGVTAETAGVRMNDNANASYYNKPSVKPEEIISGSVGHVSQQADELKQLLMQRSS